MLKQIIAVLLTLAASSSYAGTMGNNSCDPKHVTVPCEEKSWDLGIQALYLKSIYDADKVYENTPNNGFTEIKNAWSLGYRVDGSYHFNTGNDITLNYLHYSAHAAQSGLVGSVPVAPFFNVPFSLISRNKLDLVNLVVGQHVDVSEVQKIRFFAGLQFINIQSLITNFYPIASENFDSLNLFRNIDFRGFGPILGFDYAYHLTDAVSVVSGAASSLIAGTSRYNSGFITKPVEYVISQVYASVKESVPGVDAKLGLAYDIHLKEGVLKLEGGYQLFTFFHALSTRFAGVTLTAVGNSEDGPYLGFKYLGHA